VRRFKAEQRAGDELVFCGGRRFSAEFYLEGNVANVSGAEELAEKLSAPGRLFVVMPERYNERLPASLQRQLTPVQRWKWETLYVESMDAPNLAGIDPAATSPIGQ